MSFSLFKSFSLGKLLRLNVSKSGVGVSLGPRGASVSIGPRGTYLNVSPLPGSGIRMRTRLDKPARRQPAAPVALPFAKKYIGRKFIGDIGKGHDETITIVDVTLDGGGEPTIHITFNDDDRRYGYSLKRFGERFMEMREIEPATGRLLP
jgi:Protein of unknown function (DUF4236)